MSRTERFRSTGYAALALAVTLTACGLQPAKATDMALAWKNKTDGNKGKAKKPALAMRRAA